MGKLSHLSSASPCCEGRWAAPSHWRHSSFYGCHGRTWHGWWWWRGDGDYTKHLPVEMRRDPVGPLVVYTRDKRQETETSYQEALRSFEQLLHIYEHIHGPDDPNTADALCQVVNVQRHFGNSKDAIFSCERAMRIERSIYGNKHLESASTLGLLGACYNDAGQHEYFPRQEPSWSWIDPWQHGEHHQSYVIRRKSEYTLGNTFDTCRWQFFSSFLSIYLTFPPGRNRIVQRCSSRIPLWRSQCHGWLGLTHVRIWRKAHCLMFDRVEPLLIDASETIKEEPFDRVSKSNANRIRWRGSKNFSEMQRLRVSTD
jgi:hypothetical protein